MRTHAQHLDHALLQYSTWNIGDEVQSIAARQFLPRVDVYLDRDRIGTESERLGRSTALIMNGWWMHGDDWPPRSPNLRPLLTSMFLETRHPVSRRAFRGRDGLDFLRAHGTVGARDLATLSFLRDNNVPAYFSGCLTLTLQRDPEAKVEDFLLAVDLPRSTLQALRRLTTRPVIAFSTYHEPSMTTEQRFTLAELYLLFLQSAACVVTTRLHALLPSIAFGTPALLVTTPSTYDASRFDGLGDLGNVCTSEQLEARRSGYDFDEPPAPLRRHTSLREALIEQCSGFTGHDAMPSPVVRTMTDSGAIGGVADLLGSQIVRARKGRVLQDSMTQTRLRPRIKAALRVLLRRIDTDD